jgi:hypothetical protein
MKRRSKEVPKWGILIRSIRADSYGKSDPLRGQIFTGQFGRRLPINELNKTKEILGVNPRIL